MSETISIKELLIRCLGMVLTSKVCPNTPVTRWPKIILHAHHKGYLFTNMTFDSFVMAYRIPFWDERFANEIPEMEAGSILYVPWAVSESKDKFALLRMLRSYPHEITEIIYYRRNSDTDFKRLRIKGKQNVETKVA